MTEPDVALTDYGVALECVLFLVLLQHCPARPGGLRSWFTLFFASISAASAFGGTVHGFFLDEQTLGHTILWSMTLLAMGVATLCIWAIGATLLFSRRVVRWVLVAAGVQLGLYGVAVFFLTQEFWVGLVDSLPAVLFLLFALGLANRREKHTKLLPVAGGLVLFLVAALLQQLRIGIHPDYFNHNALYHVLQAVALFLFFTGGRWLVVTERIRPAVMGPEGKSSDLPARNATPLGAFSGGYDADTP